MPWFFTDAVSPTFTIDGENAKHIEKSLRMKIGEEITVCDKDQVEHRCVISNIAPNLITLNILESKPCENEPDVFITLYQALPKGDKMDYIIQKSVELGVSRVVPVLSNRCISRPDEKSMKKKILRWQKIALQAAQQSRRGIVPVVNSMMTFKDAAANAADTTSIIFYECGGESVKNIILKDVKEISVFIGSEGGFEEYEVRKIINNGGKAATLGKRILRAETAPLAAVSVIMYETNNLG